MTKRWMEEEAKKAQAKEMENCGCKYNMDDKFLEKCAEHQEQEFNQFWGEPISVYTDEDAIEYGDLTDISFFRVKFNNRLINRLTIGAALALNLSTKNETVAKNHIRFIAENSKKDSDGADAWGIFEPDPRLGNEKMWLVNNEVGGYTILLPSEY